MSKKIKLKDLLKENFSGTMMGGVVSRTPFHNDISLAKIVKEKYGETTEEKIDVEGVNPLSVSKSEFDNLNKDERIRMLNRGLSVMTGFGK